MHWLSAAYTLAFAVLLIAGARCPVQITAWACLAPLAVAFLLVFGLPMQARDAQTHQVGEATAARPSHSPRWAYAAAMLRTPECQSLAARPVTP